MQALSKAALIAGAAFIAATTPVAAQTPAPAAPSGGPDIVSIVRVAKPWYAPPAAVQSKMRDTFDQHAQVPGLVHKTYSFERDSSDFGGIYHWRDRAAGLAWFNAAWFERVKAERGVDGQVRHFEAPVMIDNRAASSAALTPEAMSKTVATLVELPLPAGVPRERIAAEFEAARPHYQRIPGLMQKFFVLGPGNTFGGIYFWQDEAAARAWLSAEWAERARQRYGSAPRVEWFDTPLAVQGRRADTVAAAATRP
jgi:heme-degrading monooxygenase HmoA